LALGPALASGDELALGRLFEASYLGARDLYEIGAPSMEVMMQSMRGGPGVVAARQAGAGFGGCMVAMVREGDVQRFCEHVEGQYFDKTGVQPHAFPVTAAQGAGPLIPLP
jgi:galactokinase